MLAALSLSACAYAPTLGPRAQSAVAVRMSMNWQQQPWAFRNFENEDAFPPQTGLEEMAPEETAVLEETVPQSPAAAFASVDVSEPADDIIATLGLEEPAAFDLEDPLLELEPFAEPEPMPEPEPLPEVKQQQQQQAKGPKVQIPTKIKVPSGEKVSDAFTSGLANLIFAFGQAKDMGDKVANNEIVTTTAEVSGKVGEAAGKVGNRSTPTPSARTAHAVHFRGLHC